LMRILDKLLDGGWKRSERVRHHRIQWLAFPGDVPNSIAGNRPDPEVPHRSIWVVNSFNFSIGFSMNLQERIATARMQGYASRNNRVALIPRLSLAINCWAG